MRNWLFLLRDVAWSAVFAVVFAVSSVGIAIFMPNSMPLVVALGLSAVTCANLSQRI